MIAQEDETLLDHNIQCLPVLLDKELWNKK
jgi:hypothetical protein